MTSWWMIDATTASLTHTRATFFIYKAGSRRVRTAQMRQQRTRSPRIYVRLDPPKNSSNVNAAAAQRTTFGSFFGKLQRDSPFTFGQLIGPYGGTKYVLGVYMNIMVRCAFLPCLQLFATTNLTHSTFVAATLLPCWSCAPSSRPSSKMVAADQSKFFS